MKHIEEEERRKGRRRALIAGVLAGLGGLAGGVAGGLGFREVRAARLPEDATAGAASPSVRALVLGPLDDLVERWYLVLSEIEVSGDAGPIDPHHAMGISRLADHAWRAKGDVAGKIRRELLMTRFPAHVERVLMPWREVLRRD